MSEKIEALVEGGKASAGPPLGPALGPLGINIGEVIKQINEKTKDFSGMKVPVTVIVDGKDFKIKVGTPPVSAMIKKEANVEKLSPHPKEEKVADLKIEQVIKIAKNKKDSMNSVGMKSSVRQVIGSCVSCGILVEGKNPKEVLREIDEGKYEEEIRTEKTELTAEELKELEEERKRLAEERKEHMEEMKKKAEEIMKSMEGKERKDIITRMHEEEIPQELIDELLPKEEEAREVDVKEEGKKGGEGKPEEKKG
ncbi:MAG: 50S ribosomal protein L11 [archaeon]|nr:MAG: 50S ribosomal protein L11 [archaeon]